MIGSLVIPGLSDEHQAIVSRLAAALRKKRPRNRLRMSYYDFKSGLKDIGIGLLPPQMRDVEVALGWGAKAVDGVVRRTVFTGMTALDGSDLEGMGWGEISRSNRLETEIPAAAQSSLIHSCVFGMTTAGIPDLGEQKAVVTFKSAEHATGTWDRRRRVLTEVLSVNSFDAFGNPNDLCLYVNNLVVTAIKQPDGHWYLWQSAHVLGVPVEVLPYRADLDRPFGRSRISRPVMYLTDAAIRTMLRTEVGAEFYNSPQRYALGADDETWTDETTGEKIPAWRVLLGGMLTLTRDEDGNLPTVGQFPQQSMEPNIGQARDLAQKMAAETNLPLRSFGVVGDNPESADAISEANRELELEIRHWTRTSLAPGLERLATNALRMYDDSPAARRAYDSMRARFANPSTVSTAEAADALVKLNSVFPDIGSTSVGLELAGLDAEQIERYQAERKRAAGQSAIQLILAGDPTRTVTSDLPVATAV